MSSFVASGTPASLRAQGPTWSSPSAAPAARSGHAMAYDTVRGRVVMFGGDTNGETWEWVGSAWIRCTPQHSPSPRTDPGMAYDPVRRVTVLYGGSYNGYGSLGDTWEWDGEDWTQASPLQSPWPFHRHGLAWHGGPNPGILLQGGYMNGGVSQQTWLYNGVTWTLQSTGGPHATGNLGSALVYVPSLQVTCAVNASMFGGAANLRLWAWNGSTWNSTPFFATSPVPGSTEIGEMLAYLPGAGGANGSLLAISESLQVTITPTSTTQATFAVGPAFTPALRNGALVGDTARRTAVLFGGQTSVAASPWTDTNAVRQLPAATGTWTTTTPTAVPTPRTYADMTHDAALGTAVLFGGRGQLGTSLDDTWTFDGSTWTDHGGNLGASPRVLPGLSYLAGFGTVLFGGATAVGGTYLNDTLFWNGASWIVFFTPNAPTARYAHDMAATSSGNRVYLFGGYNGAFLADTWRLGPTGWTQLSTPVSPPARANHRVAYDERRSRLVLFGGQGVGSTFLGDTWEFGGSPLPTWTQTAPATSPSPRWAHGMGYDQARGVVVMTGGYDGAYRNDVWEYNGTTWRERPFTGTTLPAVRENGAFAYHAARQRFVLQSGNTASPNHPTDTWFYSAAIDVPGLGTPGNSRILRNRNFPIAGQPFAVEFDNPSTFGWLLVDPTPQPAGATLPTLNLFCSQLVLYGENFVIADAMGDPGTVSFVIPSGQLGRGFTCQGISLSPTLCLEFTDPLLVTPQAP